MHVTSNFVHTNTNETGPNHELYMKLIGYHPDRLKNLFFLYAVILRAINRAEPILRSYDYATEIDPLQDQEVPIITD